MRSLSCIAAVFTLIVFAQSAEARAKLQAQKSSFSTNVECVVQAFGSNLEGKGMIVEVRDPGFGCGPFSNTPISNSADFFGGEAEVALTLPADNFQICSSAIVVAIITGNPCEAVPRVINRAGWGGAPISFGDCRALDQQCGSDITPAAIPYIDMWCRRPASQGGQPEGMLLSWSSRQANDVC